MQKATFVFHKTNKEKVNTDSHTKIVDGELLYQTELGYGFVTEDNKVSEEMLQIPEANSGFARRENDSSVKTKVFSDERGCFVEEGSYLPLCFKIDVVRLGNYEITVDFMAKGEVLVFAGARRLVYRSVYKDLTAKSYTCTMNVCDIIPGKKAFLYEQRSIDLTFVGEQVILQKISLKYVNSPTVYIAGDESVMDKIAYYPYNPLENTGGWGQMLSAYIRKGIAVSNHSKEQLSIAGFRQEGYYAMIKAHLRLGDYVLLHFSKTEGAEAGEVDSDQYRSILIEYIEETRAMGAYPILVTPFCRNVWLADGSKLKDKQYDYAIVCREVGHTYHVPVIDLYKESKEFIVTIGQERAQAYFMQDGNRLNDIGAYKMAGMVSACYIRLMHHVRADAYARLSHYFNEENVTWIIN